MYTWPSKFPAPSLDHSHNFEPPVLRTEMDDGYVRQRPVGTVDTRLISCAWRLTPEQYKFFQAFLHYKLNCGADWFQMELDFGDGFAVREVRFKAGDFTAKFAETHWLISAVLECVQLPTTTDAQLNAYMA